LGRFHAAHTLAGDGTDFVFLVEWRVAFRAFGRGFRAFHATLNAKEAAMLKSIGLPELVIILVVAVLLFGGKKIPEVAKGLGEGIRNFKNSLKGDDHPDEKKPT